MPEEWVNDLEKKFRELPHARVEAELEKWLPDTEPRKILLRILEQRRADAAAPEKERFDQSYSQTERHHSEQIGESRRQSRRAEFVAWAAFIVSLVALWLQFGRPSAAPAERGASPSPEAVLPSPSPSSAP